MFILFLICRVEIWSSCFMLCNPASCKCTILNFSNTAYIAFFVSSVTTRGPDTKSPHCAVSETEYLIFSSPPSYIRSTISFSSCKHSKYASSGWYPASTNVSNPAFTSAVTPPQSTACSPNKSVSVSSLNVVSNTPALVAPIPSA